MVDIDIGRNLRAILAEKGWSPAELIRRSGLSRNQLYKWLLPKTDKYHTEPLIQNVVLLAQVLRTTTDEILLGKDSPNPSLIDLQDTLHRTLQRVKESPPEWQTKIPREVVNFLLTDDGQEIADILLDPPVMQFLLTYARGKRNHETHSDK